MRFSWSDSDVPANRGFDVAISAKIHPTDQMSTGVEYVRDPINTSGARYHKVTTYILCYWLEVCLNRLHLMCITADRDTKSPRQTKISKL
mmetsp:Transcript_25123/g.82338  ORF Transcript_25123/g.82338 Transcript_25123/m.82338 type:complete len:90 (-) Transcript_25123:550-819(-)